MRRKQILFILFFLPLAAACSPPVEIVSVTRPVAVTETATAVPTPTETPTPATDEPTATAVPAQPTAEPNIDDLLNLVQADLPENAFAGLALLSLNTANGPLWAVYSVGFHNFDLDPWPSHFVALYSWNNDSWQEVARQLLNVDEQGVVAFGPDYLPEQGVTQVQLDPNDTTNLWLAIDGGVGAHGGTFQLLRFDGTAFHLEINTSNSSPGVGYFEDLNGDGTQEVILRQHDYYVFCYACGVRYLQFGVYTWDDVNQRLLERSLQPMLMGQQGHPARQPTNRAVELANADLWPPALAQIEEAERLAAVSSEPTDIDTLNWDAALIRLYNQAYQAELDHTPYPLLTHIFYGDFAAALDLMRGYGSEQIFSAPSPLIQGTVAEGNEQWLADYLLQQSNAAIAVPELDPATLAAAYYFHAWGSYLNNPADAQITADLQQAATLAPNEPLFNQVTLPDVNHIQFGSGETAALLEGDLPAQGIDVYVLSAQAGQNMMVMLTVPDEAARITVQDSAGNYLNGQMASTLWQGTLPESGDYVIRVIGDETAASAGSGQAASYRLQVIIPQRITFAPGATSATIEGDVAAYEADDYILAAQEGQTMRVTITSPGANVLLTIVGADGIPLINGNMSGATTWQGELPATQDYTIRAIGTLEPNSYTLTVTIE